MLAYILRRLVIALVAIVILATITFFLLRLVPGDPFASPRITTEVRARLHAHYGLDKPLIEQYLIYMQSLAQGDFGYSLTQRGRRVNDIIRIAFPVSRFFSIDSFSCSTSTPSCVQNASSSATRTALRRLGEMAS